MRPWGLHALRRETPRPPHARPPQAEAGRDPRLARATQQLFWAWAAHLGLVLFAAVWLQQRGLWAALVSGDPSGISLGIVILSAVVTLWCGRRAWRLQAEVEAGAEWRQAWVRERGLTPDLAAQRLGERTHGPHETAWWFAAASIKLGLLGTVVGFMVMATQIGRMPSFDLDQVQNLLKQMTQGMAIALYTTLVGLIANLWLGLQLLLLDRMADRLVADILADGPEQAGLSPVDGPPAQSLKDGPSARWG